VASASNVATNRPHRGCLGGRGRDYCVACIVATDTDSDAIVSILKMRLKTYAIMIGLCAYPAPDAAWGGCQGGDVSGTTCGSGGSMAREPARIRRGRDNQPGIETATSVASGNIDSVEYAIRPVQIGEAMDDSAGAGARAVTPPACYRATWVGDKIGFRGKGGDRVTRGTVPTAGRPFRQRDGWRQ
jgi:hypothetical protein